MTVTPEGSEVYVADFLCNNVSAIATPTNRANAAITVCGGPVAFGVFIRPRLPGQNGPRAVGLGSKPISSSVLNGPDCVASVAEQIRA